ncbi:MAG: hypothetical protein A2Y48_03650 [Nitrospirae bacterium RIFCSPLOW2_12_42_9]|nr:MAG: hypothetical protein A2035_00780 [Nitrospirae bacterium GWA2_42_11]OGW53805.1 MAG: hypothetical protein A2Z60_04440 [Nitrospirae bacterium RIFCSPLOWO2_02_42_7]OGW56347.1 MAG: hypothetical protein A3D21_07375 [Nitrospirae bacterium RIFCSPHIGHO2_02_FULL_42_12]OGW60891.1 MAG: hypothetical protein A2Y48_03650 [Nitrospirae bacterium RIFCSPLOW2_12_42_9]HAS17545.1 DUF503 domain-containing protein [Nitrospiraceae bacterium]
MVVGICIVELHIPDSGSLKGKRQVIKSIKDRIRQNYNVSVAEIDGHDLWQRVVLGIACIGVEKRYLNGVLDKVINMLQANHTVELLKYNMEFL